VALRLLGRWLLSDQCAGLDSRPAPEHPFCSFGALVWIIEVQPRRRPPCGMGSASALCALGKPATGFIFGLLLLGLYVMAHFSVALATRRSWSVAMSVCCLALASVAAVHWNPQGRQDGALFFGSAKPRHNSTSTPSLVR